MTSSRRFAGAVCILAVLGCAAAHGQPDAPKEKAKPKHTNRLSKETSPYLLMHAHNPTDWYPWGPEAFAKAKKEGKLVFLSIGYSSCYWCHVMERESFNNEAIAKILNKHFVCIKVDREERPDIDTVYMTAVNVLRQRGGWPLSMFLTADAKPIVGGTYWPPEDKMIDGDKMPGFKTVLNIVQKAWTDSPKEVEKQAADLAEATSTALERTTIGIALAPLERKLVEGAVESVKDEYDETFGGFGSKRGPKFPQAPKLLFLLDTGARMKAAEPVDMVSFTLDKMARGGTYDHLGGGFHRYSTERTWTVPHFEKMLYDNAQLVEVYARAWRLTKNPQCRRIVNETLAYVGREMTSPEGAFYSSQDAETHHEEGRFYVWTRKEIEAALTEPAEREFIDRVYGLGDTPNFEKKYHILTLPEPLADVTKRMKMSKEQFTGRLEELKQKLFDARSQRDRPFLNKIALTAWSGQMIAGYAEAGMALGEKKYVETAAKAADFVLKHQKTKEGRLLRTYGAAPGQQPKAAVNAYLEDYAFLVHGLLCLHDATKDTRWLDESRALTDTMIKHHGEPAAEKGKRRAGGYYFTAHDHEKLFARGKDQYDGAQPSGNSGAARNLVRLWDRTGEERYRAEAEALFKTFAAAMKTSPSGLTTMVQALDMYLDVQERKKAK